MRHTSSDFKLLKKSSTTAAGQSVTVCIRSLPWRRCIQIGGVTLDLSKLTTPIYHLAAREDHIALARSVLLGAQLLGGSVRFVVAGSGHIAGVVNPPARNRYQYWTDGPPVGELETWLEAAEEHPGSWWPDWQAWSEAQDSRRVPARESAETSSPLSRMHQAAMFG